MRKESNLSSASTASMSSLTKSIRSSKSSALSSSSLSSLSSNASSGSHKKVDVHKTKKSHKHKHRYSSSRNSRSSISRLGSIQEENEEILQEELKQKELKEEEIKQQNKAKEISNIHREDSIEYMQAIKAIRHHLNENKLNQQSKSIVSVINETVKSLEATLLLNNYNNNSNRIETSSPTKSEKAKYTLTRVIKKVTFHPNKSNENSTPDKRVELLYIWGAQNKRN